MLGKDLDAASAGFRAGYEDVSHFSREYKRLFGEPPMRDVGRLQLATGPVLKEGNARQPSKNVATKFLRKFLRLAGEIG